MEKSNKLEYEISYGLNGEKAPEFYYFFSSTYYPDIMKYVKETVTKNINYDAIYIEKCKKIKYLFPKSNILNSVVYIMKHIAYMAYYPDITEKVISKCSRIF